MNYCRQLDGLRCVAVLLVLMQHFLPQYGNRMHAGFIGVNLFFVLSGFLITAKLDQSRLSFRKTISAFYLQRFARIIPIYYLTIIVLFFLDVSPVREYALHSFLFFFNIDLVVHDIHLTPITHFWSLAVEMQFYLIWPFLILPLRKKNMLLMCILVLIVIGAFMQFYFGYIALMKPYRWVSLFPLIFAMASGSLGYYIYKHSGRGFNQHSMLLSDFLVLGICTLIIYFQHWTMFILLTIASVYFILRVSKNLEQKDWLFFLLGNGPIVYLGKISYGIYLFHLPFFFGFMKLMPNATNASMIITTTIATIVLAVISFHWLENPLRKKIISLTAANGK
jgi:peptidoglycan/LPS O-acetylase OafA/YrhL